MGKCKLSFVLLKRMQEILIHAGANGRKNIFRQWALPWEKASLAGGHSTHEYVSGSIVKYIRSYDPLTA